MGLSNTYYNADMPLHFRCLSQAPLGEALLEASCNCINVVHQQVDGCALGSTAWISLWVVRQFSQCSLPCVVASQLHSLNGCKCVFSLQQPGYSAQLHDDTCRSAREQQSWSWCQDLYQPSWWSLQLSLSTVVLSIQGWAWYLASQMYGAMIGSFVHLLLLLLLPVRPA